MDQKLDIFHKVDIGVLAILGVEKSYSELFQNVGEKFHNFVFFFLVNVLSY